MVLDKGEGPSSKDVIVDPINGPVEMTPTPLIIPYVTSTHIPRSPWWMACTDVRVIHAPHWFKIPACLSIVVRIREDGGRLDLVERMEQMALPINPNLSM